MQNVLKLVPKPVKKDFFGLVDNTEQLRFTAKLKTDEEINKQRPSKKGVCYNVVHE